MYLLHKFSQIIHTGQSEIDISEFNAGFSKLSRFNNKDKILEFVVRTICKEFSNLFASCNKNIKMKLGLAMVITKVASNRGNFSMRANQAQNSKEDNSKALNLEEVNNFLRTNSKNYDKLLEQSAHFENLEEELTKLKYLTLLTGILIWDLSWFTYWMTLDKYEEEHIYFCNFTPELNIKACKELLEQYFSLTTELFKKERKEIKSIEIFYEKLDSIVKSFISISLKEENEFIFESTMSKILTNDEYQNFGSLDLTFPHSLHLLEFGAESLLDDFSISELRKTLESYLSHLNVSLSSLYFLTLREAFYRKLKHSVVRIKSVYNENTGFKLAKDLDDDRKKLGELTKSVMQIFWKLFSKETRGSDQINKILTAKLCSDSFTIIERSGIQQFPPDVILALIDIFLVTYKIQIKNTQIEKSENVYEKLLELVFKMGISTWKRIRENLKQQEDSTINSPLESISFFSSYSN